MSWKTALSNKKKYSQQSLPVLPFYSVLNAITQGNGVWEWELLDSCQKERESRQRMPCISFSFFNKTTKLSSLYPISAIGLDYFTF